MENITFKELTADNLFDFAELLEALGTDQLIGAFDANEIKVLQAGGEDIKNVGIAFAGKIGGIIIKNLSKSRNEIYAFFAGCTQWENGKKVTIDDIRKMKLSQFVKLIKDFFTSDGLMDFFKELSSLFNTESEILKNS